MGDRLQPILEAKRAHVAARKAVRPADSLDPGAFGPPRGFASALLAARAAGARRAFYTVLRLPWELSELFQQWLRTHFPDRAERVMARVREMRGGQDYDSAWGQRMHGQGLWADLLRQRFDVACRRLGLNRERFGLDVSRFRPGALGGQADLFEG